MAKPQPKTEARTAERAESPASALAPADWRRAGLESGLRSMREARAWLRRLGDLGIAVQLVVAGVILVWVVRRPIGIHSTGFLLVVLLLPGVAYLVLRRPEELSDRDWLGPVTAFRSGLAALGELGRVVELGLLSLFLMWFTSAVIGANSIPLLALELVVPQVVYLILSGRERRLREPDELVGSHRDTG